MRVAILPLNHSRAHLSYPGCDAPRFHRQRACPRRDRAPGEVGEGRVTAPRPAKHPALPALPYSSLRTPSCFEEGLSVEARPRAAWRLPAIVEAVHGPGKLLGQRQLARLLVASSLGGCVCVGAPRCCVRLSLPDSRGLAPGRGPRDFR